LKHFAAKIGYDASRGWGLKISSYHIYYFNRIRKC